MSYVEQIQEFIREAMTTIAREQDTDIRAALTSWAYEPELYDLQHHVFRVENEGGPAKVEGDHLVIDRTVILGDGRHLGAAGLTELVPIDTTNIERVYEGQKYRVVLLHRDEVAKCPDVRNATEPVNFITEPDE